MKTLVIVALTLLGGAFAGTLYARDITGSGNLANTASLEGTDFKFAVDGLKASYEGKLRPTETRLPAH